MHNPNNQSKLSLIQNIDNNDVLRPLTDGFDIGTINRQSQDSDNDIADDIDPGNCDDLGLSTTYEKVLDFTYEKGSKEEIGKKNYRPGQAIWQL